MPSRLALALLVWLILASCVPSAESLPGPLSTAPDAPTRAPQPTLAPTPTFVPDTGWETLRPGLERRVLNLLNDLGKRYERIYILRLDPSLYRFSVAYHPQPQSLADWQKETGALIVVNGGYYRQEGDAFLPTGLSIIDGKPIGSTYGDFAGMFAVGANGPELRWLAKTPYDPAEPLQSALQSFPLLVKPGGELGFPASAEDSQPARRTAVARDREGRFLFILAPLGYFTLHQFSAWLAGSDLELDLALNLDGGPSTGLFLAAPPDQILSYTSLPEVITVRSR